MKPRTALSISFSSLAIWASFVPTAKALDLYWDADGATTAATGGTGTWDTGTSLWRNGSSTGALQTYDNTSPSSVISRFGGTAGTVTLSGTLNAGGLNFGVGGYTLTGGTALNLIPSASPFTYTTNGGTNTINSTITSAGGTLITKTGAGTLVLGNGGGGASNNPALYTITGGTFDSGTKMFGSILSMVAGNRLGNANADTTAAAANPMVTLDAGTIQFTQNTENGNNLSNQRGVKVTANGGAINDAGGPGAGTAIPSAISNNAGGTLHLSNVSGTTQFQGAISGNGSVTWYGAGTASFQASNTYSGDTVINGGILALGGGSGSVYNFGQNAGTVIVNNGGTLRFDRQDVFGGHTSVPVATVTVNSGGIVTGNGFYNTLNNPTLNGGTLQTATGANFWGSFALKGTVTVGGSSVSTITSSVATDNFIRIGTNTAGGTTTFNVADSTGNGNADLTIAAELRDNREPNSPFNEVAATLTKSGAGTLSLYASNNYSGGTSITGGALSIGELTGASAIEGSNTGLGTGSVNVSSGAQLIFSGNNLSLGNNITLNGAATVSGLQGALVGGRQDGDSNTTLSGTLTLAGSGDRTLSTWWSDKRLTLTGKVTGTGTLRVVNATSGGGNGGSIVILSNTTNDYSGGTTVDGGGNGSTQTLRLGANNVLPDGSGKGNVTIDGRLELKGYNDTINGLNGGGTISLDGGTLTIGNNNAGGDSFVAITGPGNLTKIGTGTQILRGTSDIQGTTTISSGTLQVSVNGTSATLGSGDLINNAALTFQRQNDITVSNSISGMGSVSQIGAGTLILAGTNTYTGATNVSTGTLRLTSTLSNTAISVASGATFSPTATTSAGLNSGSAGANLTLNSGAVFDMTSTNAGAINTFTLNPGSNSFSGQALSIASANLRFDLGSSSADRLQVNSGTVSVTGTNNIRFTTGSSLTPNTYTLIGTTAVSGLAGNFQFDGGSNLSVSVPAQQQIKNIGSTYFRLTLQNSPSAEQVVVSAAPANLINVMPMGSSITEGVSSEGATYNGGGYRSQLYQKLVNDGRFTPHYVGSQTVLDASNSTGYNVLTGANELNHEGHSGYTTTQVLKNLNANGGDGGNNGGFWLAPANGKNPDYVTLSIGGNDYGANSSETDGPLKRTDAIVSQIQSLRSGSQIIVSNLFNRTQNGGLVGMLQDTYYNPGVQGMVFNHVLAGHHVSFYDAYAAVTPGGDMSYIHDTIHPDTEGYRAFANGWYDALANGSAFWTGSSAGTWANFAQNYQLTTPRQTALSASTDVHFNSNAAPLNTTLGQDMSVRSVNFATGATGAVTIGGSDALTIGAGGITVQAGTGAHTISSNVVLGTDQTWGNVSSNAFTVAGSISGSKNLTIVGTAVVQLPGTLSSGTYTTTTQTVSGTGAVVLSGANNTYAGSTMINSGVLKLGANNVIPDGAGKGNVTNNGTLDLNGFTDTINGLSGGGSVSLTAGSILFVGNNDATSDFSGNFGGTNTSVLRKIGSGTFTLSGPPDNSGTRARIEGGTLVLGKSSSGSVHAVGSGGGIDYALQIAGGTVKLGGSNGDQIYQNSSVNMTGGTFDLAGLSEGFDGLSGNAGTITNSIATTTSTLTLGQNHSSGSPDFSGIIQNGNGTVALTKTGSGTQALNGANTYSGGTTINAGTLAIGHDTALGSATVTMNDGATLANNSAGLLILANGFALSGSVNGVTFTGSQNLTINGSFSGGDGVKISKTGASVLTLSADNTGTLGINSICNVSGGSYDSLTGLYNNVLAVNSGRALGNVTGHILNLDGGTLRFTDDGGFGYYSDRTINVLAGGGAIDDGGKSPGEASGGGVVNPGISITSGATLSLVSSKKLVLSGVLSGNAGAVTKFGTGTTILSGTNTYTGATTLKSGTLVVNGDISASLVTTVNSGATLAGSGTVGPVTTVGSTSVIAPGSAGIDILKTGNTTLTGILDTELNATSSDLLQVTGDLNVTGAKVTFTSLVTPTAMKYVIAKYSGALSGTLASTTVPAGYELKHDTTAKEIQLVKLSFATFMDGFSGSAADKLATADLDHDGISNLLEYALAGSDPSVPNALPGGLANGVLSFTKRDLAVANGDLSYAIEESPTLGAEPTPWTEVTTYLANDGTTISYTLPVGQSAEFTRLKVIKN